MKKPRLVAQSLPVEIVVKVAFYIRDWATLFAFLVSLRPANILGPLEHIYHLRMLTVRSRLLLPSDSQPRPERLHVKAIAQFYTDVLVNPFCFDPREVHALVHPRTRVHWHGLPEYHGREVRLIEIYRLWLQFRIVSLEFSGEFGRQSMEGLYLLEHIVTINAGVCTQSHSTTIFTLAGRSSTLRELKIATNAFRIDDRATVTFSMGKHFVKWITSQPVRVVELSGFSYIDNNVRNEIILALFQCATLESLCMLHMNLSSIPLNQPFPQRMRRLTLSRCDLLPNDFRSLAAGLQQSYIEELDLSENSRLDQNGLLSIFSALPNSKITRLRLIGCVQYGENISWELAGPCLLESRMKSLDLSRNNITNMDATFLAQGIRGHKTLESLDVSWNQFGYKGVLALVEAASPSLRRLCFGDHLEDFCPQDEVLNIQKMAAEKSIRIL